MNTGSTPTIRSNSEDEEPLLGRTGKQRLLWIAIAVVVLLLAGTLPPLLNVNRYQRRVNQALEGAIGRPVHFDRISVHLLPLPGLTLENFIVSEDSRFGAEPVLRANVVEANLRIGSLWRRRVEISRIRLEAPSVNLVRSVEGTWNLQTIVSQASRLPSAPTAQRTHGAAPRFPYIEAQDARLNIKFGDDKLPYSLADVTFALWLPNEQEWHLRLAGRPIRTDTDVSDTGRLELDSSLGRQPGKVADQPIDLRATWKATPLGEASKLLVATDAGWRGAASGALQIKGTVTQAALAADLQLRDIRRADFVPVRTMQLDLHCGAQVQGLLRSVSNLRCTAPTGSQGSLLDAIQALGPQVRQKGREAELLLKAEIPDTLSSESGSAEISLDEASPDWILDWLRLFTPDIPPALHLTGTADLQLSRHGQGGSGWTGDFTCQCFLPPVTKLQLPAPASGSATPARKFQPLPWNLALHLNALKGESANATFVAARETAASGYEAAVKPASVTASVSSISIPTDPATAITGEIAPPKVTIHYASLAIAQYASSLYPDLRTGMPEDAPGPLTSERNLHDGTQTWSVAAPAPPASKRRRSR